MHRSPLTPAPLHLVICTVPTGFRVAQSMVQVEQHTDAALTIVGEEHRALEHFDWREAVGAKRYGPSCHSRLEVHLLHHSVLLEKREQLGHIVKGRQLERWPLDRNRW